jgi:hypothetical protein
MMASLVQRKIDVPDGQWREVGLNSLISQKKPGRQGSAFPRNRRKLTNGVGIEIFLMDRYGLSVAMSDVTSDYW